MKANSLPWKKRLNQFFASTHQPSMRRIGSRYIAKMQGEMKCPPRPPYRHILWSLLGGFIGIAATGYLSLMAHTPLLMAPFGATCVLAFGVPDSPLAQPCNIIG